MKHLGTKRLETERLLLRPFTVEDRDGMYRNWASDSEVTKYLTWPAHSSPAVTEGVLKDWVAQYGEPDFYQWAIVLRSNGTEPIGSISVVEHNDRVSEAVIGYCIGRSWWRQGITSEALKAVICYLTSEVGLNRIVSYHDVANPNSGAVMRKCGMRLEGVMRQADRNNQGVCDICQYAILASDLR